MNKGRKEGSALATKRPRLRIRSPQCRRIARRTAFLALAIAVICVSCRTPPLVDGAPDPTREAVVLIHGMRRTGRSMRKMARAAEAAGYNAIVCSYPSDRSVHATATNLFAALGPVIDAAPRVHFVTHSLGGILVRDAFRDGAAPPNLGRVVMLGPPNGGSQHIDRFSGLPLFETIWGTPAPELGTGPDSFPARLPPIDFPCGVIAGSRPGLLGWMLPGENDGKVTVASAGEGHPAEVLVLPTGHTWMMRNGDVIADTLRFLQNGTFLP